MPNSFVDHGVFAKVGVVHMVVQPLTVCFEEAVKGRGQVVNGGIDNLAVRGKSPCRSGRRPEEARAEPDKAEGATQRQLLLSTRVSF